MERKCKSGLINTRIYQIISHEHIIEANKIDYYMALNKTQATWKTKSEDITAWLIFLNVVKSQSTRALQIIKNDNI